MWADHWVAWCIAPLALWILLSGLDDLFIAAVRLTTDADRFPWPPEDRLDAAPERRIAILVPLWREHRVIGRMLEHNLSVIRYSHYDFFVGVYPNDPLTERAVAEAERRNPHVHLVVCPHDGPTSKGDCLNWIFRRMENYERRRRVRYEIVITHDAEDLVHPEALRLISWFSRDHEMVQIPVLALPTPPSEFTHGIYCDEFAEYQCKDIPARQRLGGFLPSNGVGTGFSRDALERLARDRDGRIFDPEALTEDYDNGFRLHALGCRQIFVPVRLGFGGPVATREYFPRRLRAAVRQRSRWVAGIALQGWEHHGWRAPVAQIYWLWRDRKGLIGNLLAPLANLIALYVAASWCAGRLHLFEHLPASLLWACAAMAGVSTLQMGLRARFCAALYGWRMAALVPLRILWANQVNGLATVAAIAQFLKARARRRTLAWRKTDHVYPAQRAVAGRPRLGEVLIRLRRLSEQEIADALDTDRGGLRLGEYLVRARKLSEDHLYEALSAHAGIPLGRPAEEDLCRHASRVLPAETVRRWRVLPYRVAFGQLHLLTSDIPTEEMARDLAEQAGLEIRFRLVRPRDFAQLSAEFLGEAV